MKYFKILFSVLFSTLICSFKASADFRLEIVNIENNFLNIMTKVKIFFLTGDGILLIGFLIWIAYVCFFLPGREKHKL